MMWLRLALPILLLVPATAAALAAAKLHEQADTPLAFSVHGEGPDAAARLVAAASEAGFQTQTLVTGPAWLGRVDDPARHVYVAIAVERAYTGLELDALRAFAARGGHWLVADPGPAANPLLDALGVDVSDRRLRDPLETDGWVALNASVGGRPYAAYGREPSALILAPGARATVLASSRGDTFLDVDADANASRDDYPGPLPVVALLRDGAGTLHLVSADVGLFLDAQPASANENHAFALQAVRALLPAGGTLLYDEARHTLPPHERRFYDGLHVLGEANANASYLMPVAGVAAAGVAVALSRQAAAPWGPHRFEPRALPFPRAPADAGVLMRRAALTLLGRKAGLSARDLQEVPTAQLVAMTKHDPDVTALLQGRLTPGTWHRIETRLEGLD